MLILEKLKTENLTSPVGVPLKGLRFSWQVKSDKLNQTQVAYHIIVKDENKVVWDSKWYIQIIFLALNIRVKN